MKVLAAFFAFASLAGTTPPLAADTLDDTFVYMSPQPWANLVSKDSVLVFRPRHPNQEAGGDRTPGITVTGSVSGPHSGEWVVADDSTTLIFRPSEPFEPGEVVSVALSARPDLWIAAYRFTVSPKRGPLEGGAEDGDCCAEAPGFESISTGAPRATVPMQDEFPFPSDFPQFDILTNNNPTSGKVFLAAANYLAIINHDGTPVFFMDYGQAVANFGPQANGMLTFFERGGQGAVPPHRLFVIDDSYTIVDEYAAANGYLMDFHDFLLLENGHALLMIYDRQPVDMSRIVAHGNPRATVQGLVIQELDASKNLVFQWRSWDHIPITDAADDVNLGNSFIDYVHGNAIEVDVDGNLLLSSRNLDEITKIDRLTGEIIWRFGGKGNQFQMRGAGRFFSHQHDVRRAPNGNITVFDNGNLSSPQESRAVEFQLVEAGPMKTATQVWDYRHPQALFGPVVGSHRTLPTGNHLVSWANQRHVSEVRADGFVEWELELLDTFSYRAYHDANWKGVAAVPTLWIDVDGALESATLRFVRFGASDVARFNIYRGTSPETMALIASTARNALAIHGFDAGTKLYFRATALDDLGHETGYSNEISFTPDFSETTPPYTAGVRVQPRTLNLTSQGRWVLARVTLPESCLCEMPDFEWNPILLNGTVRGVIMEPDGAVSANTGGATTFSLEVRFPRAAVADVLEAGESMEIRIGGRVGDIPFEGRDFIRVIRPGAISARSD